MVRPPVQQTTAVEQIATHGSQEEGEYHFMGRTQGEAPGWVRRPREGGENWTRAFIVGLQEGKGEAG